MPAPTPMELRSEPYHKLPRLDEQVEAPKYGAILRWMKAAPTPNVSFDFWARGNYTRHLLWQRQRDQSPVHVAVKSRDHILESYRRLALLGLPVEFIYVGEMFSPQYVNHLIPGDFEVDAGWGYVASVASYWKHKKRRYGAIAGVAQLMPEELVQTLTHELAGPFASGEVFLAPAELIGVDVTSPTGGVAALAQITNGSAALSQYEALQVLLNIELPYLERLSFDAIHRIRQDYDPEFALLRDSLARFLGNLRSEGRPSSDVLSEIATQVIELRRSAKYARLQRDVLKLGGAIGVFAASVGALAQSTSGGVVQSLAVAGATAASVALVELFKQAREARVKLAENHFYPLWQLGLKHERDVRMSARVDLATLSQAPPERIPRTFHWLCPPSSGCQVAFAQDDQSGRLRLMTLHEWYALTEVKRSEAARRLVTSR